jgi:hypothetical protein
MDEKGDQLSFWLSLKPLFFDPAEPMGFIAAWV